MINRFIFVGCLSVLVDFLVYKIMIDFGVLLNISKGISFVCGAIFSYYFNKNWTFSSYGNLARAILFAILYLVSLLINIISNNIFFSFWNSYLAAFIFATVISATINYFGMKKMIFTDI